MLHFDLVATVGEDLGLRGYREARPFMSLPENLAAFFHQDDLVEKAVEVYEEMITLNPEENQGIRGVLLPSALARFFIKRAQALSKGKISSLADLQHISSCFKSSIFWISAFATSNSFFTAYLRRGDLLNRILICSECRVVALKNQLNSSFSLWLLFLGPLQ